VYSHLRFDADRAIASTEGEPLAQRDTIGARAPTPALRAERTA